MIETNMSESGRRGVSAPRGQGTLFDWTRFRVRSFEPAFGPPGAPSLPLRRLLTICGCVFLVVDVVLRWKGVGGAALPVVAQAGATLSFLGSFIISMTEPGAASRSPDKPRDPSDPSPQSPQAASSASQPSDSAPQPASPPNGQEARPADGSGTAAAPASAEDALPDHATPLLRPGNSLRPVRGGAAAILASVAALLLMGHEGQLRYGVPLGALFIAIASWGVMDFLGTFDDPEDRVVRSTALSLLARPLAVCASAWLLFLFALGFASSGSLLPQKVWGVIITLAFMAGVATVFDVASKLGIFGMPVVGTARPVWRRYGFWVIAIAAGLYFPFMGTSSLWDPWETHYGEVSREILARDDWISLWWAQDGWFWSKPVLDMWMQAIAMATLGVHYQPDKMLIGGGTLPLMHPEWAVRAPIVILTILAMYVLYTGVARSFGHRAAFLGTVVLASMPDWFLLAHQTMTDMPFVATMTASIGFVLLGSSTAENLDARAYEVSVGRQRFRLTAWHLVFFGVLVCVLPQILYLASRNIEFLWRPGARGFHLHWDEFRSGSGGGNCGLPGNEECKSTLPAFIPRSTGANPTALGAAIWRTLGAFEPAIQAVLWSVALGIALYMSWGERRVRRLLYVAGWLFAGLSTLAKGPAGVGVPVLVTLAYLAAARPDQDILARILRAARELAQLEIVAGLLILLAVSMPWYVAMYVRHGPPFTDRLIFHDMFNRAFHHVHDTNEGDDTSLRFYVWQLGYALFPWTALAPIGLLWWMRERTAGDPRRYDTAVLLTIWFVFTFALFSFMGTKFHHYILPAVPPVAMLIGLVLDEMLGERRLARRGSLAPYLMGLGAGVTMMVIGVARTQAGSFFGFKPTDGRLDPGSPALGACLLIAGIAMIGATVFLLRPENATREKPEDSESSHGLRMLAAGCVSGALLLLLIGRDLVFRGESADQPGAIRLLHLYTYNYRRPWPDALDFSAALIGFTAIASVVCAALAVRAFRHHATAILCVLALVWGTWGLDVYMQRTAQHWGQHEILQAYYADRASPDEMLIAYQMNWKGENFYTGNRVPAFVSTGATFTGWLKKQREAGVKVLYFITEHGRIGGLKNEVGAKSYREVTDKTLCNKFVLVRAVL